jgi:uncharacterized membrane protein
MRTFLSKAGFVLFSALLLGVIVLPFQAAHAAGELTLFTPNANIGVTPGESVNYNVELINNTSEVQTAKLNVLGLPDGWDSELTSGSWKVKELAVKPQDTGSVMLRVDVPLQVAKGEYRFTLTAGNSNVLPLAVEVTEQGTFKTELTTDQPNMEGHSDSSFTFSTELFNRTAEKQTYALRADTAPGWDISFVSGSDQVSSVEVEAGAKKDITVKIKPPKNVQAGTYDIPITADNAGTSAQLKLQVSVKGTYDLDLSTPSGLLSTSVTAGKGKKLELQVQNTGTVDLKDVKLSADTPIDWTVTFDPPTVDKLAPGETKSVIATIDSANSAIAGDYVVSMSASSPEAGSDAQFRVSVKTSVLWSWIGVLIIAGVAGGIYYLFRKYGRR